MESRKALDTNVLVYLDDEEYPLRGLRAKELLAKFPTVSAFVMAEYIHASEHLFPSPASWLCCGREGEVKVVEAVP